jgi:dihydrofolate reductase / thymidylate synthase
MEISIIVAYSKKTLGIGKENRLPWNLKGDMAYFKKKTISLDINYPKNSVIMGRNTWESIPEQFRPLERRNNIVISNSGKIKSEKEGCIIASSLEDALKIAKNLNSHQAFIIGGAKLYSEAIHHPKVQTLYVTEVYDTYECDTFFPDFKKECESNPYIMTHVSPFQCNNQIYYRFMKYYRKSILETDPRGNVPWVNKVEKNALDSMRQIVETGQERIDRTGIGTRSLFGMQWKYDLSDTFPIWTSKRIFFRAIFEELKLYITGKTDNRILQDEQIYIWDGNTTREFLDKRGLTHYKEGDMGETYGFNMRHFGAEYKGCEHDYTGQGYDQLQNVLDLIKNDPSSRRMLITLWNPSTTHKASLPACMFQYQFYVNEQDKRLNLQVYLRSSDYFLANNWNVCTGALLVHLICNLKDIDLTPGELTVVTGDTHIYLSHLEAVAENLKREPRPFPKLHINKPTDNLADYVFSDIKLIDYCPYPNIRAEMAV